MINAANFVFSHSIGTVYGYISSIGLQRLSLYVPGSPKPYLLHETPNLMLGRLLTILLDRYFSGIPEQFEQVPLDLTNSTEFQQRIWTVLRKVRWGTTCSYAELAELAQFSRKHARAVGQALHKNPIPIIIPCHRVLSSNYSLGGFSAGLDWKRKLLQIEQIELKK